MSNTLLPCPFCGGEAELYGVPHIPKGWDFIPRCKTTSCCGRQAKKYSNRETAIAAWNRRAGGDTNVATNADRIRGMSDEELAEWLTHLPKICTCHDHCELCIAQKECDKGCEGCIKDWLRQPAETEGTE